MSSWHTLLSTPKRSLVYLFVSWKALLLLLALFSPGPGYDTSTTIILPPSELTQLSAVHHYISPLVNIASEKLTRWDAIYYAKISQRGYLSEQEWAFGWGYTRSVSLVAKGLSAASLTPPELRNADPRSNFHPEYCYRLARAPAA